MAAWNDKFHGDRMKSPPGNERSFGFGHQQIGMMGPPSVDSPRPSSVGSAHSNQSESNKMPRDKDSHSKRFSVCVGEELKISVNLALKRFRLSEEQKELDFPSSLTSKERAYIHQLCPALGLTSKSKGKGAARFLTIRKKEGTTAVSTGAACLQLVRNSRHQVHNLLQRFPLTNKERQDLTPRVDRSQYPEGSNRELNKATTGRLNNGVPQIPPSRSPCDLSNFRQTLPVYQHKDDIVKVITENRVVLISGETGSGKTTQVPQMILDDHQLNGKPCRILCTQPRRISALSVAERVAAERGEKIGQTVGYQIRLESRVSPKTLLTFCTNGVLLRTLMGGDGALSTVTHIVMDEIHERDRFSDFLMIVLRESLPNYRNLHVILMSAALDVNLFSTYWTGCPIMHIPGKLFDVKEYFLEDVLQLTGYFTKKMKRCKHQQEMREKQKKYLEGWCTDKSATRTSGAAETESPKSSKTPLQASAKEREELEMWVIEEMDQLLTDVWLTGNDEPFSQIFNLILNENVSVDYQHSDTSASALMIAAARGMLSIVEQLLNLGASVQLRASNDWTALDWAHRFQHPEIVDLLQAHMLAAESGDSSREDALLMQQSSRQLTEEERELLSFYHDSFDDSKVDLNLTLALLIKIYTTSKEGGILIFLPGYDEIVALRDMIGEDKKFADSKYKLYVLHSSLQASDQRKVFRPTPQGVRKIVLSTNIAETSVTINDIVYVIDAGKVKEKSFDALTSVSMLACRWVSKASALQRKGRAGRCQPGVCYHLFSRVRHDSLMEYQDPEILRYPLQELCLHTKLLAPANTSIADFLSKAPEAPAYLITRNAVHLLKQIDALDPFEDLTELGHHLADLPIEPRFGKMVLHAVVLKCLDPILTIACALSYRDPYTLPIDPSLKRAAANIRRKFSASTHSDHMALLRAFQSWQRARTEGWERSFCEKNFLSAATMEMIFGIRTQLLGQLRASGFVRARGGGDIRDLNTNSENWAVVKAALVAGMYPNVIRVDRSRCILVTNKESKVRFHPSSVLSPSNMLGQDTHQQAVMALPTDWLIYEEMTRAHHIATAKCCTLVSPMAIAIFSGPAKLNPESLKEAENAIHVGQGDGMGSMTGENSSDSETEKEDGGHKANYKLDDWIHFKAESEVTNLVVQLRQKWQALFIRRMRAPAKPWSQVDESVIRGLISVLTNEEQAVGLQQPAGIGQRPKPMSAECLMSATSNNPQRELSDQAEELEDSANSGDWRQSTPKTRPFKFTTTPPKRRDAKDVNKGRAGDNAAGASGPGSGSGSANNSGRSSQRGSTASSPCQSPQSASPAHSSSAAASATATNCYFVMKATSHKALDVSFYRSIWPTNSANERKLNKAVKEGKTCHLVFSVHGSGHFQGYARVVGTSSPAMEDVRDFAASGLSATFPVEWIKRGNLPFQYCHHLTNPWNENKRVQISRDGQELESSVGDALIKQFDKIQAYQPKMPGGQYKGSPRSAESPIPDFHGDGGHQRGGGRGGGSHWNNQGRWSGNQGRYGGGFNPAFGAPFNPMMGPPMFGNAGGNQSGQGLSPVMILQRAGAPTQQTAKSNHGPQANMNSNNNNNNNRSQQQHQQKGSGGAYYKK